MFFNTKYKPPADTCITHDGLTAISCVLVHSLQQARQNVRRKPNGISDNEHCEVLSGRA